MVQFVEVQTRLVLLVTIVFMIICLVQTEIVPVQNFIYNNNGLGTYRFEYKTEDGTFRREEGGKNPVDGSLVVRGEYGYIDPRGYLYKVRYVADSNGFQPVADEETRFNDRNIV